jgi:acetylornithine deacetylase/succinyl-diaminopimelate desuccinylase-like protein
MRLVHDQDPDRVYKQFEKYVRELVGDMATVEFRKFGAGRPFRAEMSNPFVQAGLRALEAGFGKPAIVLGMGGSIPIVSPLVEITGAPCALMGFGLPSDNLHAPNEHFPVACFLGGARSAAAYLNEVASTVGAGSRR